TDQRCEVGARHFGGLFDGAVLGRQLFERHTIPRFRELLLDLRSRFDSRRAFVACDCLVQLASHRQNVSDLYERSRVRWIEFGSLAKMLERRIGLVLLAFHGCQLAVQEGTVWLRADGVAVSRSGFVQTSGPRRLTRVGNPLLDIAEPEHVYPATDVR